MTTLESLRMLRWGTASTAERRAALRRPAWSAQTETAAVCREILADVRARGDVAVREYARRLDGFDGEALAVSAAEWDAGAAQVASGTWRALERAAEQIERFHAAQLPAPVDLEVSPGVRCRRVWRPLQRVGLYVPGGTAPLPSTVLMLGVPARLAGCSERLGVTPVGADGRVHPAILAAARVAGLTGLFKVGGAHAVAALAYGTGSVPRVDKIFGPGNAYVTQAKLLAAQDPDGAACDLPAGPSEVMVVADRTARPEFVAADLLSQAEHGVDSQAVLVAFDQETAERALAEVRRQLPHLPRRKIAEASLAHASFIVVDRAEEALAVVDAYAPEHLIFQTENAAALAEGVRNAGSIFIGPWSPEAVGDYASGTNHVLPTYGLARNHSGLTIEAFLKSLTLQELTPEGLRDVGPVAAALADVEGLGAHAHAVRVRLDVLGGRYGL